MEADSGIAGSGCGLGFGERPALLVVDLIRAFTDARRRSGRTSTARSTRPTRCCARAHERSLPVIFTVERYDRADFADAGCGCASSAASWHCAAGTPAVELDERLARGPADHVIVKKFASAFFATDLVSA